VVKFTKVLNLTRFDFSNGKLVEEKETDFTIVVRPKSTGVTMFKVDGKHNGIGMWKFESKFTANKEKTDTALVIHMKENATDIS